MQSLLLTKKKKITYVYFLSEGVFHNLIKMMTNYTKFNYKEKPSVETCMCLGDLMMMTMMMMSPELILQVMRRRKTPLKKN